DHVGEAVTVDVRRRYVDAAGEAGAVGKELVQQRPVGAVEDLDVRPAAAARRGDDVGGAVAVHVADRHADPAAEGTGGRRHGEFQRAAGAVVDVDHRHPAGVGADGFDGGRVDGGPRLQGAEEPVRALGRAGAEVEGGRVPRRGAVAE